jgi:hypothetical protein
MISKRISDQDVKNALKSSGGKAIYGSKMFPKNNHQSIQEEDSENE